MTLSAETQPLPAVQLNADPSSPQTGMAALQDTAEPVTVDVAFSVTAMQGCGCPICAGMVEDALPALVADAAGIVQLDSQGFLLDVSNPLSGLVGTTMANGLNVLSSFESAIQIARPGSWVDLDADLELTFSVSGDGVDPAFAFDADYRAATREIFGFYAEISGLTFREIPAGSAEDPNMKFMNIDQYGGGGWASLPGTGINWSGIGRPWTAGDVQQGSYVYKTLIHEIGHLLGLMHPGNYNGSVNYLTDAVFWNDSRQYSVMSYMDESVTGANYAESPATLMLLDILAIQIEYGINWTTRAGNTTYGFNSNSGVAAYSLTDEDNTSAFTIWDGAGRDTLNFSGFDTDTVMDLRQGGFSSTGIETHNIAIAYNAVIENAVGGSGDDRIRGNEVANRLEGGAGRDILYGGADTDAPLPANPRDFVGIALNTETQERGQSLQIANLTSLSGPAFTVEMLVDLARVPSGTVPFLSYAVTNSANEFLLEGSSGGTIKVTIDGLASYDTQVLLRPLADGEPHRLSMSWDSATGTVSLYVDGTLRHEGIYTAAVGHALASGGTLIIGQEQDTVGGGFNTRETLQGTVGDIRIFGDVRTAQEIANSAFTQVAVNEQGLLNNWNVRIDDTTRVADFARANPPVNLTDLMPTAFTATQSSAYNSSFSAANVLDNNTSTQNHTNAGAVEWLNVALDRPMEVTHVQVQNITGWGSRLNGATVSILDANGQVLHTFAPISGEGYWGTSLTFQLPTPMLASAVRITHQNQNLHVSEINIFGNAPAGVAVPRALLDTSLSIIGGATAVSTAPSSGIAADSDVLIGGAGRDELFGGAGHDRLFGDDLDGANVRLGNSIQLVALNPGTPASGTTDQWLDQTAALPMPATALTLEMVVRLDGTPANNATLFGYGSTDDNSSPRFTLRAWSSGWDFYLNGVRLDTTLAVDAFSGPEAVRLSVTWNNADGAFQIFIDGALAYAGNVGVGAAMQTGGQFWVMSGHNGVMDGAVGDIRLWNHVRTAAEIAADAMLAYGDGAAAPSGLLANWQVDGTSGTLANTAGTGQIAALTVTNVTPNNPLAFEVAEFNARHDDTLNGGAGNDSLDGGAGRDVMIGGAGNDIYVVDSLDDQVFETTTTTSDLNAGGVETVQSSVSFNLDASAGVRFVERLVLTGTADADATGNALANTLIGNSGNNVLNGGLKRDVMIGGAGNDTYVVNATNDRVYETTTTSSTIDAGGVDRVISAATFNLDISAGTRFVENLTLTGTGNASGTGNALANQIIGNAGRNVLNGGLGNDTVTGGEGTDVFVFSTALGTANIDRITDFDVVADTIHLDDAVFAGLSIASLGASAFASNLTGAATAVLHRIIYEADTGKLFFDADGNGNGARVQFATLTANLALTDADFVVF